MSPAPDFWPRVRHESRLIEQVLNWSESQLANSPTFTCRLTCSNGASLVCLLDVDNTNGTGVLRIPLQSKNDSKIPRYVFMNLAATANQAVLHTEEGYSTHDEFRKLGLHSTKEYRSTYCSVKTNSASSLTTNTNYSYLTIYTERSHRAGKYDFERLKSPEIAVGVVKDITDTLQGFTLTPIKI